MNKQHTCIVITIACIAMLAGFKLAKQPTDRPRHSIAILQTASHPALDAAHKGFVQEITRLLGDAVHITTFNAQGSITQAHALAQRLHASPTYDAFFAIATPAAQALASVEKERPIAIAAVTDPHALGLVHPTTNVCGTKDMIDTQAAVSLITTLVPTAKKVGLLYTTGESNAQALIKKIAPQLTNKGIIPVDCAISSETDISAIVEHACKKVDLLFAPTDNTVATSIAHIAQLARKHHKPLVVSDTMLIQFGAAAAQGIDYFASGTRSAQIAHSVITQGIKPFEIAIEQTASTDICIHQEVLDELGITVPTQFASHTLQIHREKTHA